MELIPILSTIILVATISTFILAVGAYILFKIREGKAHKQPVNEPTKLYADYIVPKEQQVKKLYVEDVVQPKQKKTVAEERYMKAAPENSFSSEENLVEEKPEIPKQKFINVHTLDTSEQNNQNTSGEIKWR